MAKGKWRIVRASEDGTLVLVGIVRSDDGKRYGSWASPSLDDGMDFDTAIDARTVADALQDRDATESMSAAYVRKVDR